MTCFQATTSVLIKITKVAIHQRETKVKKMNQQVVDDNQQRKVLSAVHLANKEKKVNR